MIWCLENIQSGCGSKKLKPVLSRITGGGSISEISMGSFDFDMSSTENGMLQSRYMLPIG